MLGVTLKQPPPGIEIEQVQDGSAADRAGIRPGDRMMKLGEADIRTFDDLAAAMAEMKPGQTADALLYRDGEVVKAQVKFDE